MAPALAAVSVALVLGLLLGLVRSDGGQDKVPAILKCFDGQNCLAKRTTWEHFTEDLPSCLHPARVWWSARPAGIPVTLVTQLSVERLPQLRAQCALWNGPLAAALYLPLLAPDALELTAEAKQKLQAMVGSAEELFQESEKGAANGSAGGGCQLRLVLLYELFADPKALVLYPVNSLRNYARLMADTDLITNIDVDMIPSASISTALANPATLADYTASCRTGSVYVWPAFETHCGAASYADNVAVGGKAVIPAALKKCMRKMRPKAPYSHNATNYVQWLASDTAYRINYTSQFEPWFLSWRWGTLWYDYRFRGYGKNKIVHVAAMNATGTAWYVSPHGFIVHRKHTESKVRKVFLRAKFSRKDLQTLQDTVYGHVELLWAAVQKEMAAGTYMARVERGFQACMESLPWWQR
ncbi:Glycosyltransferase-like protein LARGE [Tetrabaena socialis]|uniref:Glycosyltransferase-like protein LARGE n=1 Tax=Tetrabaena socialis TaxID=47790 RepID=A0A2J8AJM6_9CHLO|nr:Glycosyltransferase-like protein LARGE [Tetrabaena socialis]|eukprot:PNH12726.1 Glycosyltransferase-like protein LARGE [Tetrabaena socialis]